MQRSILTCALASAWLMQTGCDAKAGDGYRGEPLLSFEGSVKLASTEVQGELEPALAFVPSQGTVHILDVSVRGTFPANFTLDVLAPPPAGALTSAAGFILTAPRSEQIALGYITAVPAQHKSVLRMGVDGGYTVSCEGGVIDLTPPAFDDAMGPSRFRFDREYELAVNRMFYRGNPGAKCTEEVLLVADDGQQFRQLSECDHEFKDCRAVQTEGDPGLLESPWKHIAGLSTNYLVLYLPVDVDAGTPVSRAFGGKALSAGYHLLQALPRDEDRELDHGECVFEIDEVTLYNMKHGTNYAGREEIMRARLPEPKPDADGEDSAYEAAVHALRQELRDLALASGRERCKELQPALALPVETSEKSISIEISKDVDPVRMLIHAL